MMKIVAERGGAILGVHIAGPWATELIAEAYLTVNWEATPPTSGCSSMRTRHCASCSASRRSRSPAAASTN